MNNFRKGWYFVLVLGLVSLVISIIQITLGRNPEILGGRPSYSQNIIIDIIGSFDFIITASLFLLMPVTGAVGDERTRRAAEKASLYAFLILVGCLILLSGAGNLGGINSLSGANNFLLAARNYPWMPFILAHIGIYSWVILVYYFVKKSDM